MKSHGSSISKLIANKYTSSSIRLSGLDYEDMEDKSEWLSTTELIYTLELIFNFHTTYSSKPSLLSLSWSFILCCICFLFLFLVTFLFLFVLILIYIFSSSHTFSSHFGSQRLISKRKYCYRPTSKTFETSVF